MVGAATTLSVAAALVAVVVIAMTSRNIGRRQPIASTNLALFLWCPDPSDRLRLLLLGPLAGKLWVFPASNLI